jgi:hypothetical protein
MTKLFLALALTLAVGAATVIAVTIQSQQQVVARRPCPGGNS